jgi:predicted ATPase/DNA-binding CsgD family transcriptional regulator
VRAPLGSVLPAVPTPLIDRAVELEMIHQRLVDDHVRLITLTGPAGVGKTRLALEAANQLSDCFPDGVIFVDLTSIRNPDRVLPAVAHTLGVAERNGSPLLERLEERLADLKLLLILDNFERVLSAASQLADLLAHCRDLALLVTSRVPLHLRWEQTLRIAPLVVPNLEQPTSRPDLAKVPAVAFFLQRAEAINSDFELTEDNARAVAELVVHLDGLPLAIELAAALASTLSPQMILERLERRLSLLYWEAQDLPKRQRSLNSAIGWSYDLLDQDDQALFQQLGVFVSGFDIEAAEAVVTATGESAGDVLEGLASLVDKSLIQVSGQGEERVRYWLLESIREYAYEQLASSDGLYVTERAHAHYYVEFAASPDPPIRTGEYLQLLSYLELEYENLGSAIRWLLDHGEPEVALRLAAALGFFWRTRGHGVDGRRWLEETLRMAPDADPSIRIAALLQGGMILSYEGDFDRARDVLQEGLAVAWQSDDGAGITEALNSLGMRATLIGDHAESLRLLQEAVRQAEGLGDGFGVASALGALGYDAFVQAQYERAASLYSDSLARFEELGDVWNSGAMKLRLAFVVKELDDRSRACRLVQDGIEQSVPSRDRWLLTLAVNAALSILGEQADPEQRAHLLGAEETFRHSVGYTLAFWEQMSAQSVVSLRREVEQQGWGAAFREGRLLSFTATCALTSDMLDRFAQSSSALTTAAADPNSQELLTEREQEVLHLVAEGLSSKVIGGHLFISPSTVNYHLTSIFNKLGVNTRAQAVASAAERNLL